MKTVTLLILLVVLLLPALARADGAPPNAGTPVPVFLTSAIVVSDTLVKLGPGFLQCIMFAQADAAPTAGTVSILDHTAAGGGTAIFTHVFTTAVFMPFQICPQRAFTAGLMIDVTTSADINISVSYR